MADAGKRWVLTTPNGKSLTYSSIDELLRDAEALHSLDVVPRVEPPGPRDAMIEPVGEPALAAAEALARASQPPPRAPSEPPAEAASEPPARRVSSRPPAPAEEEPTPLSTRDLELAETSVEEVSLSDVMVAPNVPDEEQAPVSLDPDLLEELTPSENTKTKSYRPPPKAAKQAEEKQADSSRTSATVPPSRAKKKNPAEAASVPPTAPEQRSSSVSMIVLAAVVAIGFVGVIAYLSDPQQGTQPTATPSSEAPQLTRVVEAERALADGELAAAEEKLGAIAQADPNPRVLVDLARVANARADQAWLTLRIVRPGTPEETATRDKLRDLSKKAREAAEAAVGAAPTDVTAVRAKLDALRIANEVEAARALVDIVSSGKPYDPETDYVLAALDLAETSPPLAEITVRLRAAAEREGKLARARAALVYALAMAGDLSDAQVEVDKLAKITPPHPLLDLLRATAHGTAAGPSATTVTVAPTTTTTSTTTSTATSTASPTANPTAASTATATATTTTGGTATATPTAAGTATGRGAATPSAPTDVGGLQRAAAAARRKGDLARAQQLYEELLKKAPGDSDALTGLGDTLRAQGDSAGAIAKYRAALAVNPRYLPANIALADTLWDSGQKGEARSKYQDIAASYAPELVPDRVKQRAQ